MTDLGSLISFYSTREDSSAAMRQLQRRGFGRVAMIHKSRQGRIRIWNVWPLQKALLGSGGGLSLGALIGLLAVALTPITSGVPAQLVVGVSMVIGGVAGWLLAPWIQLGVDTQTVEKHARWLVPDETVLILQGKVPSLSLALAVLRRIGENQPSIYPFHPRRSFVVDTLEAIQDETLTGVQLEQHALLLASEQRMVVAHEEGEPLLGLVDECEKAINAVRQDLEAASRLELGITPSAEWILDNAYIVQGHIDNVRQNLPKHFYHELPLLPAAEMAGPGSYAGAEPRAFRLATEMVTHTDGRLDRSNIAEFLETYQSVEQLTMGELWAMPLMLRIALIDRVRVLAGQVVQRLRQREAGDFWANRLVTTVRQDPNQLFSILAALAQEQPEPTPYFAVQLTGQLYDEDAALVPARSWLERRLGSPLAEFVPPQQARQAADQVSMGNAITSLRQLALLDWREIFERLSRVEGVLRGDPSGDYRMMDFDTRDRYRHAVEEIARGADASEEHVARTAVRLASTQAGDLAGDPRVNHVGSYLIGPTRRDLIRELGGHERARYRRLQWAGRHPALLYLGGIGLATAVYEAVFMIVASWSGASSALLLVAAVLALLPASQLAVETVNYWVTRLMPPRILPKMSFGKEGIPGAFRTLVVVPVLLANKRAVHEEVEKLEIRYLANPDSNIVFGLFSDFPDALQEHKDEDATMLRLAVEGIEALNSRYGANRFYLFHRDREWCESEGKYIGWERKRGKLEDLNRLLCGEPPRRGRQIVHVGDPDPLANTRFVITLDSDTQLPHDTARRLIETLSHPLNRPWLALDGTTVGGGYTIIQPRVSTALPSATTSAFSRLFTDPVGSDPYTKAVSDVYQDLAGEGSYLGKAIYDPRAFYRSLAGRFPEQLLLSHDLIEGAHVRVGLASDIELYDDFPADYLSFAAREHRWIRGDWQIVDWILPHVPGPNGKRIRNPLTILNRWKIFDNLRRSLVPPAALAFLVVGWMTSPVFAAAATGLVGLTVFFQPLALLVTWATSRSDQRIFTWGDLWHDTLRSLVDMTLLPHRARVGLHAISRVCYRRWFSRRKLLEWTTAQVAQWQAAGRMQGFIMEMGQISLFALAAGLGVWWFQPSSLLTAAPLLSLWLICPLVAWWLTSKTRHRPGRTKVSASDLQMIRRLARQTWRYFDDFVRPETNWLPPDNYQVSHQNAVAPRTSPTNIGLWMLSALGAYDFGYLAGDQVVERLTQSYQTIDKLELYRGHLLNWYDVVGLEPLEPRYVSTVDSGNLLASLWTLESGIHDLMTDPVVGPNALLGLADTLNALRHSLEGAPSLRPSISDALERLGALFDSPPDELSQIVSRLRKAVSPAEMLAEELREAAGRVDEPAYWAEQIRRQLSAWIAVLDRYLTWVDSLASEPDETLAMLVGPGAILDRRQALALAPSLEVLASGSVGLVDDLRAAGGAAPDLPQPVAEWLHRLLDEFSRARWFAGEVIGQAEGLIQRGRRLADGMEMRFLYDAERRLFCTGYNVREQRLDSSHYDLLASEARLASFVAISRGEVRSDHWLAMQRPYRTIGRRSVLLSWSGTMFEYMMPFLLQRLFENSLLDSACREAIRQQIAYGSRRAVPWGISEAAYGDLDINKNYQYKAFGVPRLGLKRGLEEELVVAPYATLLALNLDPGSAVRNLKRMARMRLLDDYGFFESIDFSRARERQGGRGVIVRAYMAHHQAMSFLAIDNFIHDLVMQRRFHADSRVRATEPLLYERIPVSPALIRIPIEGRPEAGLAGTEVAPSVSRFVTPNTPTPKTLLLSNGRYGVMVTNAGGGYSRWRDLDITRWRADTTRDASGSFCYIRDVDSERFWSTTYQPVPRESEGYTASLAIDRAELGWSVEGIDTETEIIVSPEDDAEIRRVTMINRSNRTRHLEITSYLELALAPHSADRQHPAFSKLFVETQSLPSDCALLASRRPRAPDDPPVHVGHRLTFDDGCEGALQFESDRSRFIGRGQTLADPAAMHGRLSNTAGFVLDPILSLRRKVAIEPGKELRFSLVLCAADSREKVLDMISKYRDPHAISQALDLAWAHAQLELRLLRIQPDDARRFQQLASFILFPSSRLRPPPDRLQQNKIGQSRLWAYGISGDFPLAVVSIGEARDLSLVRQMLQAHTYWSRHGLKADLLILNEESTSYDQPLNEELSRLVQGYSVYTGVDQPGGVFLRNMDQVQDEDLTLILTTARVTMMAARGPMAQQLAAPGEPPAAPASLATRHVADEPSAALPFMDLSYFNGLGGFTPDGREYVIYLGPRQHTPAPWVNVISNPSFGSLVTESGSGFVWYGNSQQNRLIDWSNDPVADPPSEAIYIRDEASGTFWTPTPLPIRELDAYRTRHGAGFTVFEHNSHGIEQELTTFVPVDEAGGEPVRIQRLRLRNDSSKRRRLSVTFYLEWTLGESREDSQMHVVTSWDIQAKAMLARNRYHPDYGGRIAFAAIFPQPRSYTADRTAFIGRNGSLAAPAAMKRQGLSPRTGAGLDPCAALQTILDLAPGQRAEVICLLGQAESMAEVQRLVNRYNESIEVEESLRRSAAWWDRLPRTLSVETPELSVDLLLNRWLLYQTLSCRIWGRSGFYQSGGAYGFRDQLQDVLALVYVLPAIAREHILRAASRQFPQGDVQHWWHPQSGAGLRSRCSDDLLWLPYAVTHYVRVTGDIGLLDEQLSFVDSRPLQDDEQEAFLTPDGTILRASLYEHCRLAIEHGLTSGPHGLPLIGSHDWNDALNRVGVEGRGESVWLGWFLFKVLNDFAELSDQYGRAEQATLARQRAKTLAETVEREGWDGGWYRRAYLDNGRPIGSFSNEEASITSLPQSWAWISGGAAPARASQALQSAWEELVLQEAKLVLLLTPPFDKSRMYPGYIKGYPPGVRENGGQYTHASIWLAMAMARAGDGDRASRLMQMLNPIERTREPDQVERYRVEPYVIAGDVYRLAGHVGRGGWTWYTGSSGWMYRVWVEEILGLKIRRGQLRVDPVIPSWWHGFRLYYRHGESIYEIRVENPDGVNHGVAWTEIDGRRLPDHVVTLEEAPIKHRVQVRMGKVGNASAPGQSGST